MGNCPFIFTKNEYRGSFLGGELMTDLEYNVSKILEEMELELVKEYKKAMAKMVEGEPAKQWRELQLMNMQDYRKHNKQIIDHYMKLVNEEVVKGIREAYRDGEIEVAERLERRTEQYFLNDVDNRKLNALLNAVHNDMDNVKIASLRKINDIYRSNIFKTMVWFDSGTLTLKQSIDKASEEFLAKGLDCIQYRNGRKVDICSYSEMALRTNSHRAKVMGESDQAAEFGIHTCYVSSHGVTCEMCVQWQGLWLEDDVFNKSDDKIDSGYPKLSEAIESGLFHPNCRHSLIYGDPKGTRPRRKERTEEDKEKYKNEQQQRKMERDIRKCKRELNGLQDPSAIASKKQELKELQTGMREFLSDKDYLIRRYDRETSATTRK
jgi:hypothetical protein